MKYLVVFSKTLGGRHAPSIGLDVQTGNTSKHRLYIEFTRSGKLVQLRAIYKLKCRCFFCDLFVCVIDFTFYKPTSRAKLLDRRNL